jgi:hypothetical protein
VQYEAVLLTLAEIGIAFAGFSGVVIVLGRRADPENHINVVSTLGMVAGALLAVVYSLLPLVLFESGLDPEPAWRVSCAVYAIVNTASSVFFFVWFRRVQGETVGLFPWLLTAGFSTLTLVTALGALGSLAAVIYILALANHFFQISWGFVALLSLHLSAPVEESAV